MNDLSRYRGSMLGLAVGDAVGTTVEFKRPGSFIPVKGMVGGGPFDLRPGEWTDDTSMALCLAASLVERGDFNATDQMERYVRWWKQGYMSSTTHCFDIGVTVSGALGRFLRTGEPYAGSADASKAGNGSLMRLAPIPLFYVNRPLEAIERAAEMSRTTHASATCMDACRYYTGLIIGAVRGVAKDDLLSPRYAPEQGYWQSNTLHPEIDEVAAGSFKHRNPPRIKGSGFVVHSLEAALWAFYNSESFENGCLKAVNLGDDADTTGAIYGQLAGAYYGVDAIPAEWRAKIVHGELILQLADGLAQERNAL